MFRDRTVNARRGYGKPFQATRLIDVDDSLSGPPPNTEFKVQPYGATTKLFANAYKLDESAAKFVSGPTPFPRKPVSAIAEWAKAESDLAYMTVFYNRAISVDSANKILVRDFTPQSYLPPASISQASATIDQAMNVIRPPVVNPMQEPVTQKPSTFPTGSPPPVSTPGAQPPASGAGVPAVATPVVQPPVSDPSVVTPGAQPPSSGAGVPPVVTPGAQPPITGPPTTQPPAGPGDLTPAVSNTQDDALLAQLKQIVPTQGFSEYLVRRSYSSQGGQSFTLDVPAAVSTNPDVLVNRINTMVYQNSSIESARAFSATMVSGGFAEVFLNFNDTVGNTPQYTAVKALVASSYPGFDEIPQMNRALYTMTLFTLLTTAPLQVPDDSMLKKGLDQAVLFLRHGIKIMAVQIISIMLMGASVAIVSAATEGQYPTNEMARNIAGMQKELNTDVLYNETRGLTAEQYAYNRSTNFTYSDVVDGEVRGLVYDFREQRSFPTMQLSNETLLGVYSVAETVADIITRPVESSISVFLLNQGIGRTAPFFRTLATSTVFAGSFIFRSLVYYAFDLTVDVANKMLVHILVFNVLNCFNSGFLTALTDYNMLLTRFAEGGGPGVTNFPRPISTELIRTAVMNQAGELQVATVSRDRVVRLTAELIARTLFHVLKQQFPGDGGGEPLPLGAGAEAAGAAVSAVISLARYERYRNAAEIIEDMAIPINRNRAKLRDTTSLLLSSFGFDAGKVADVIGAMSPGGRFVFRESGAYNIPSEALYELLSDGADGAKDQVKTFLDSYYTSDTFKALNIPVNVAKTTSVTRWIYRFGLNSATTATKQKWANLFSSMYGIPIAVLLAIIESVQGETDSGDSTVPAQPEGPIIATTGDGSRPGEEGTAVAVSVPTPQYTDAPPSITVEAALELLADNTNSVDQIIRSNAPERFIWTLVKYRRKSIRALWYAVFVGLGIPAEDATAALNNMDPTFVDASKNVNSYSGIRTNGAHGVYPRLDAFFVRNRNVINKNFASRSSPIRAKYAAVFFARFFGLRGKYYAKDLFALSTAELSQAAQLSRIAIDVLSMDSTHQDGQPPDQMPTAAEMRGYRTGPVDFTGYL